MRKLLMWLLAVTVLSMIASGVIGHEIAPGMLHPYRSPLDPRRLAWTDHMLASIHASREEFDLHAPDGALLRGWKIRSPNPNGNWVLLFHGVGDNRTGTASFAGFLLPAGYGIVMLDSRAQGQSEGDIATYGWKERHDTVAIVSALQTTEKAKHIYALGVSMGAAIALQSAAIEPRIEKVAAENPPANLREVSYDYAGFQRFPWLGKTLFRPAAIEAMSALAATGEIDPDQVSPERSVASRAFPVLLICGTADRTIPCRHAEMILRAADGPKSLWIVQGAQHAAAFGHSPAEYQRRVLDFFSEAAY
jgi:alpha-beta hydrolase superfamily lysophospholipase